MTHLSIGEAQISQTLHDHLLSLARGEGATDATHGHLAAGVHHETDLHPTATMKSWMNARTRNT